MKPAKGFYSVIQYCPDPARAEAANVGVLLFCPDLNFLDARVQMKNERVRRFFPEMAIKRSQINAAKQSIVQRIQSDRDSLAALPQLERFIASRGNEIQLTPLRLTKVTNPQAALIDLFNELVGDARRREHERPLVPELDRKLRAPGLEERLQFDSEVEVPVIQKPLRVPYAYRNGHLNLVRPLYLRSTQSGITTAASAAVECDLIQKHTEIHVKVVLATEGGQHAAEIARRAKCLFEEYQVKPYLQSDIAELVATIDREAKAADVAEGTVSGGGR